MLPDPCVNATANAFLSTVAISEPVALIERTALSDGLSGTGSDSYKRSRNVRSRSGG